MMVIGWVDIIKSSKLKSMIGRIEKNEKMYAKKNWTSLTLA